MPKGPVKELYLIAYLKMLTLSDFQPQDFSAVDLMPLDFVLFRGFDYFKARFQIHRSHPCRLTQRPRGAVIVLSG